LVRGLGTDHVDRDPELTLTGYGRGEVDWTGGSAVADANFQYMDRGANFNFESSPLSGARVSLYTFGASLHINHEFSDHLRLRAFSAYSRGGSTGNEMLIDRFVQSTIPYLQRTL